MSNIIIDTIKWALKWGAIVLGSLALLFIPHSPYLWMAVGLLWILDTSINISMEPFRALVADKLPEA